MRIRPLMALVLLVFAFVGVAVAGNAYVYESSIKLKDPFASSGDPGRAIYKTNVKFTSIDMFCLHVTFDASDPLDPGDSLSFTPASWDPNSGFLSGPGYFNPGSSPQYSRTICIVPYPGEAFIPAVLDRREIILLEAHQGSVLISQIDVEVFGSVG